MTYAEAMKIFEDYCLRDPATAVKDRIAALEAEVEEYRQSAAARKQAAEEWNAAWHERNREALAAESSLAAAREEAKGLREALTLLLALSDGLPTYPAGVGNAVAEFQRKARAALKGKP